MIKKTAVIIIVSAIITAVFIAGVYFGYFIAAVLEATANQIGGC